MEATLSEIIHRIEEIERFLKELVDVNLQLIEESEPEKWEREAIEERRNDEFLEWDVVKDEL
ncbi:hypothetical protein TEU_10515 [Thermococcus eurythermalis]|uniref:Uncharacterized protein n=1 Tax=Thermococcus eurythermalis TaxID=1505907 RepID=A0A097QWA6_9EURY|nr:hypothetical protein [Thermococcus eurythermalis]AIU70731.1 hypothetical protein TEU_10515 [Thermococcus eurythermalis]